MMNVASLELCKELYELSGWGDLHTETPVTDWLDWSDDYSVPAYDLGYLLRNIRMHLTKRGSLRLECEDWGYRVSFRSEFDDIYQSADTQEDAVAKLAIELFRKGVLTHD